MAYADLNSIHNPATGTSPPATWGDQVRDNDEYLYLRGPYICTAATRPVSPFKGQVIRETDTGYLLTYYGVTTGWRPPWNQPWGEVGRAFTTSNQSGISSAVDLTGMSVTFPALAGRRYEWRAVGEVVATVGDGAFVLALTDTAPTQAARTTDACLTTSGRTVHLFHDMTSGTATITRKLRLSKAGGSGTLTWGASLTGPALLVCHDVGPGATAPAS